LKKQKKLWSPMMRMTRKRFVWGFGNIFGRYFLNDGVVECCLVSCLVRGLESKRTEANQTR
jgi:hypothetical protein